jgi:flagellar hook-length control protein FliK
MTSGAASLAGAGAAAAGLDSEGADDDCAAAKASAGAELGATSGASFCSSAAVASTTYLAWALLKQSQPLVGCKTEAGARTGKTLGSGGQ